MDQPELERLATQIEIAIRDMLEPGSYVDVARDWTVASESTELRLNVGASPGTPGAYSLAFEINDARLLVSADAVGEISAQLHRALELVATRTTSVRLRAA